VKGGGQAWTADVSRAIKKNILHIVFLLSLRIKKFDMRPRTGKGDWNFITLRNVHFRSHKHEKLAAVTLFPHILLMAGRTARLLPV
jgi:hypothetical protein